jgi:hypothetical protein
MKDARKKKNRKKALIGWCVLRFEIRYGGTKVVTAKDGRKSSSD